MKKVLIYRIGEIGDSIVAIPTLRVIIREFKLEDCEIHFLKKSGQKITLIDFVDDEIYIKKVFTIGPNETLFNYLKKIVDFRKEKYDYFFYLNEMRSLFQIFRDKLFFNLCSFKKIYGLNYNQQFLKYEPESIRIYKTIFKSAPEQNFYKKFYYLKYKKDNSLLDNIKFNKNFINIGISLLSKNKIKNWNLNKWGNLLFLIQKHYQQNTQQVCFYFYGGKNDFHIVNSFLKLNSNLQSKNLCGLYPLKSDFFLIANMNYFMGIDSGNAHIASITKVPTLVIMSAANSPGQWTPINAKIINVHCGCAGKGYLICKQNNQSCTLSLSPSSVFKKFIELLN